MNKNYTDVTIIVDRSGSMYSCKTDSEGGLNSFIDEQKQEKGECKVTLIEFNDKARTVFNALPIARVANYTLNPSGGTALLDALGTAIDTAGERFAKMKEKDRPGLVIFVVITDGEENCSKEYTKQAIKERIERQQNQYNWQFTFLGADQDAFGEARNLGFKQEAVSNFSKGKFKSAYDAVSRNVKSMRSASRSGLSIDNSYTDSEIQGMQ